jgi:hypothetical protein
MEIDNLTDTTSAAQLRPTGAMPARKPLTDEQKKTVQDILSKFDPTNLSAADAKSILKSFEDAGIKGGGLRDAISAVGFDPKQLFALGNNGQKHHHGGGKGGGSNAVDPAALQTLQSILGQYDFTNLTPQNEQDMLSKLSDSGLLKNGSLLDLST